MRQKLDKLNRFELIFVLLWVRWLHFKRRHILPHLSFHTPAPIRLSLKTTAVTFLALFLLPQHPGSMLIAMALGLTVSIATHTR